MWVHVWQQNSDRWCRADGHCHHMSSAQTAHAQVGLSSCCAWREPSHETAGLSEMVVHFTGLVAGELLHEKEAEEEERPKHGTHLRRVHEGDTEGGGGNGAASIAKRVVPPACLSCVKEALLESKKAATRKAYAVQLSPKSQKSRKTNVLSVLVKSCCALIIVTIAAPAVNVSE